MNAIQPREISAAITQLRAEIEQLPKDSGGKRQGISDDLKRRAATTLIGSGMQTEKFAAAISVSQSAISTWRRRFAAKPTAGKKKPDVGVGFKKLSVVQDTIRPVNGFTIEGPNGLRVTGLGVDDVARLWRALC